MQKFPVIVVGAGVAGLACARNLPSASVHVIEKSRGPGGRLASKRVGDDRADLGAQFFTVRDPRFAAVVQSAEAADAVAPWAPAMGRLTHGKIQASPDTQTRYVGTPYMNAFGRFLSEGVSMETSRRIERIEPHSEGYLLIDTDGTQRSATNVVVTAPVNQMVEMLQAFDPAPLASKFTMDPTWTVILETEDALYSAEGDVLSACFGGDHPIIDFVAIERSKPGRTGAFAVIHSTPGYARDHLEETTEAVAEDLCIHIKDALGLTGRVAACHRWRYARPSDPTVMAQKGVYQLDSGLWVAGDYLAGGRVEGAYLAGLEVAERLKARGLI